MAFSALRMALAAPTVATDQVTALVPLGGCLLSALWPPIAAPLVGLALACSLVSSATEGSMMLLGWGVAVVLVLWLALVGRTDRLSSLAVLLPCCLPSPISGAALAGFALDPAAAAATGALGYLMGSLLRIAAASSFSPDALLSGLAATWLAPHFPIMLVGATLCSLVSSAVAMRGSVAAGILGQTLGLGCIVAFGVFAARMENSRIWPALDWEMLVLAVLLFVLLCIATVLRGPLYEGQEGGGTNEFSQ